MAKQTSNATDRSSEMDKLRAELERLELQIKELREANALQNSVDSGLETISEHTKLIRELAPNCTKLGEQISQSLMQIAKHTVPAFSYAEVDDTQREQLHAIAAQHPRLDLNSIDYLSDWEPIAGPANPKQSLAGVAS